MGRLRRFNEPLAEARKADRVESWLTYKASQQLIHGDTLAVRFRSFARTDARVEVRTTTIDPRALAAAGVYSAESILVSFKAAAMIFGWTIPEELRRLEREVGLLDDEVAAGAE